MRGSPSPAPTGCSSTSRASCWTAPAELGGARARLRATLAKVRGRSPAPGPDLLRPRRRRLLRRSPPCRSTGIGLDFVRGARTSVSPASTACRTTSGWSPASSTAATSGSTTCDAVARPARSRPARRCAGELVGRAPPARCCTSRSTWRRDRTSTPRCAPGSPSRRRSWTRWRRSPGPSTRAKARSRTSWRANAARWSSRGGVARAPQPGGAARLASARRRRGRAATARTRTAASAQQRGGSTCRRCRRRRSAPSRRRREMRARARAAPTRRDRRRAEYEPAVEGRDRARRRAARRSSGSTCWCTASPSATTWSSTSASSWTGSPSPSTAGCRATARRCVRPPIIYGDVVAPGADDGALGRLRAVAHRRPDEGDAHRAGDDPPVVVRARRPAARGDLPPDRARDPRRGGRPGGGRDRRSSRSTSRRCARACRCAAADWDALPALGGARASGWRPPASRDETQIHTHMCYSEFGDIIERDRGLDADVISIETARSAMELLDVFRQRRLRAGRSAPASTTSTPRACPPARRWRSCCARPADVLTPTRSGSTRTAA